MRSERFSSLAILLLAGILAMAATYPASARADLSSPQGKAAVGPDPEQIKVIRDRLLASQSSLNLMFTDLQRACHASWINYRDLFVATAVSRAYNAWVKTSYSSDFRYSGTFQGRLVTLRFSQSPDGIIFYQISDSRTRKPLSLKELIDHLVKMNDGPTQVPCQSLPNGIFPAEYSQVVPDFGRERALRNELKAAFAQLRGSQSDSSRVTTQGSKEGNLPISGEELTPDLPKEDFTAKPLH